MYRLGLGSLFALRPFYLPHRSYLDQRVTLSLNKSRKVTGTLRGYDQFMNIVLGDAVDETVGANSAGGAQEGAANLGMIVIRGNSILQFELVGK
jgi:small nuclear ribonucleoprotein G